MNLIETLKSEHVQILAIFDQIDQTNELLPLKELVNQLITTQHLQKEDTLLYPTLAQSQNEETKKVGSVFSSTMPDYVANFTKIVTTIINTDTITLEILSQYHEIRDKIKNRITIEETILFPSLDPSLLIDTRLA